MANSNGWGDGSVNNNIGWGQGANNSTGWGKSHLNSWSGATDIDGGNPPVNTVAPAITGTAQEGQTLTCSTGTWSGSPTYTYQWKRNGNNITSATNSTYTLVTADVGQSIKCTVTATNFTGSATADSNTVTPTSSVDPDAQAFITAASITDPTQQSAINQLVVDLKGYNIWSKMKAIYPFCGSTASQQKWNLKDPRDLDVAFRLVFNGGWTHSSTGATPNGTNAYADTKFSPNNFTATTNSSAGVYLRTNALETSVDLGQGYVQFGQDGVMIYPRYGSNAYASCCLGTSFNGASNANTDSRGLFAVTRTGTSQSFRKRGTSTIDSTITNTTTSLYLNRNIYLGAGNDRDVNGVILYSTRQQAFAFIGDYLTSGEIDNLYTAVQAFQVSLGRSIGTQTVSDADAQAFVTNAGIVDQVEANAINNLVIGLKADGLWTKMKAVYPMVGGSSSTMKYNLKNPLDTDAAFRLVFNGGLTYNSTGLLGGVNGYADTKLAPSTSLSLDNTHISFYSRTDTSTTENVEMGINDNSNNSRLFIAPKFSGANTAYRAVNSAQAGPGASPNMQGFFIASRVSSTAMKLYRNASVLFNDSTSSGVLNSTNILLLCYNSSGTPLYYTDRECAFASIGDGLTDTEATNFYNRVQTFNTSLARQV